MKIITIAKNKYFLYSLFAMGGLFLGWLLFHSPEAETADSRPTEQTVKEEIWTCAMHPQIRMHSPGKCPICGMDLIPLAQNQIQTDPSEIHMTPEAAQLANVQTTVVSRQNPVKEVRLYGKVQADERRLQSQVTQVPGRIEKLMVNFTGETVHKGETLALIYSPDLAIAQQELIEAATTKKEQPEIYEAAREKLRQLKLSEEQITNVELSGMVQSNFEVLSTTSGSVLSKKVNNGDFVSRGSVLFDIADLSELWVMFDAYESDLQFISAHDNIVFTINALPGKKFTGKISFIDPVIDPVTRVARVRVEVDNSSGNLKPGMFASGLVSSRLKNYNNSLIIPSTAVLWTGKRSVVYVRQKQYDDPVFRMREVELGPMLGESYIITDGLSDGEEIVTQGAFSIDAAAQLDGKPSMMNPAANFLKNETNNEANKGSSEQKNPEQIEKFSVNMDFTMQLNSLYDQYLSLKNSFVQSDSKKVKSAAKKLLKSFAGVDLKLLTKDQAAKWTTAAGKITRQTGLIASEEDLNKQRSSFVILNDELYLLIKSFGLMDKTVYYQFCPMANDGKGAYWLSETEEIRNPYYGDEMLNCGETKEVIK